MQLDAPARASSVRGQLKAAACMLLATGAAPLARAADGAAAAPAPASTWDVTTLVYSERITVFEPAVRFTRLYPSGMSFHGQMTVDTITGASPSGALPSGVTQTYTSASGNVKTISGSEIPTVDFKDTRYALDGEWLRPMKWTTFSLGSHISREKDYQSLGVTAKATFDLNEKLTTLTLGGGYDWDTVFPVGGIGEGLAPSATMTSDNSSGKQVASAYFGLSHVVTRKWLVGVSGSIASEHGYLTEPYKVVSVVNASTGIPIEQLNELRPDARSRMNLQFDSVYHFDVDLLYLTLGHYWDDWGVSGDSADLHYRHPLGDAAWLEPHLRYYTQSAADFYRYGLVQGDPLPDFVSADYRLGKLNTTTAGLTVGFRPRSHAGEWTVRAEYMVQTGDGHPDTAVGVQQNFDLFPALNIFSFVVGYKYDY